MFEFDTKNILPKKPVSDIDLFLAGKLLEFANKGLITEVLKEVKSGKEATVYCCRAHPSMGNKLLAAKIYRPGTLCGFKNTSHYEEGRVIRDRRIARAVKKKTQFGRQFQMASWSKAEFNLMRKLYDAGAAVPQPIFYSDNAILMEYIGDEESPAPMLRQANLTSNEVPLLFSFLLDNIKLMLACNCIHSDLSAYNILYWNESLTIIDFSQAVDPRFNSNAYALLRRDIGNICRYWAKYGFHHDPFSLAEEIWWQWLRNFSVK